nr:hypothetical protein CFP56_18841 [Quercus suber]
MFHLIKDDKDAMFMTGLVGGHGRIHVYVQHPVHDPILVNNGNGVTLDLVVEPEPVPEGYSSSDGEPAYEDGDDFYHGDDDFNGHQYFYRGDKDDRDDRGRDDSNSDIEILGYRRPGKELIVEEPQRDGAVITDNSSDSWDNDVKATSPDQIGAGVVNSDYTNEELLSLTESSSSGDEGVDDSDSDGDGDAAHGHVDNVTRRKKFPVFKPISNPEHMRTYKNPRCTTKFLARKLMKKVRRQPNIKLKDIQEAVHEKYVVNINAGKASRARGKAQDFVDGSYIEQYNQLWDYCAELRRSSPSSTVLMKTHTYNEGDLAAEMDLQIGVSYFERLYICWVGCKEGFLANCRPIITFVYYDLCILDRFMFVMYIVQSGLCIVFAHNGAICLHTINNSLCM